MIKVCRIKWNVIDCLDPNHDPYGSVFKLASESGSGSVFVIRFGNYVKNIIYQPKTITCKCIVSKTKKLLYYCDFAKKIANPDSLLLRRKGCANILWKFRRNRFNGFRVTLFLPFFYRRTQSGTGMLHTSSSWKLCQKRQSSVVDPEP